VVRYCQLKNSLVPHYIGDPKPDSDVDILLEFSLPVGLFELVRTQRYLERLFGPAMGAGAIPLNRLHPEIES